MQNHQQPKRSTGVPKILIVEDEQIVALNLNGTLARLGYEIVGVAGTGDQSVRLAEETRPDLALMDIALAGEKDGISSAGVIWQQWNIPVVFLTAFADEETLARAQQNGVFGFLTKPFRTDELNATILMALNQHRISQQEVQQRRWMATLLASISDGVISTNLEGRVSFLNQQGAALTGWAADEALGKTVEEICPVFTPDGMKREESSVYEALRTGSAISPKRLVMHARGGRAIPIEQVVTPLLSGSQVTGAVIVFRDIKEQLQIEKAQKRESIGVLAGGVAHEFNNMLTTMIGNASLAMETLPPLSPTSSLLEEVVRTGKRASGLTQQLLAYAGKGRFAITSQVNISEAIEEILDLLKTAVPDQVRVELNLADDLPSLKADPSEIQQIVMNLVINAAEALSDSPGVIAIQTGRYDGHLLPEQTGHHCQKPQQCIYIQVRDTGPGMDARTLSRIFEPFFTTKFTGRGLGLAAVEGIVTSHGGTIQANSKPGEGTTVTVLIPVQEGRSRKQIRQSASAANSK